MIAGIPSKTKEEQIMGAIRAIFPDTGRCEKKNVDDPDKIIICNRASNLKELMEIVAILQEIESIKEGNDCGTEAIIKIRSEKANA